MFSESDSKLYVNFEFFEEKDYNFFKHNDLQSKANYGDKNNSKISVHILEDGASGVQVGDIEQLIV